MLKYDIRTGAKKIKTKLDIIKSLMGITALALPAVVFLSSGGAQAATTVVTPSNMDGWAEQNFGLTADVSFVNGPGTPPLGSGSLRQTVGANGNDAARIGTFVYGGTLISDIATLSYSTYVVDNQDAQAPYLVLRIDKDGNGTTDDRLFFEPVYQNGTYGQLSYSSSSIPNQCSSNPNCVSLNTWQTWDADAGGWWSENDSAGGPPLTTLSDYAAKYPGAQIATDFQGVRIQSGGGAPTWNNFDGNADAFTINADTYDFELTNVNVPANKDACKKGGWMNLTDQNGDPFKNQGQCVSWTNGRGQ